MPRFIARLKIWGDAADSKWEEAMKDSSFPGKSALVADDDDVVRSTLARLLRHLDMDVLDAADGAEAIRKVDQHRFDIVISDLSMPQADGFAVLESVRKKQPHTPVIILTGAGGVPDSVRAMREGAFDFLTKPFHPTALTEVVRAALTQAGEGGMKSRLTPVSGTPTLAGSGAILLGKSAVLQDLLALVQQVGPTEPRDASDTSTSSCSPPAEHLVPRPFHTSDRHLDPSAVPPDPSGRYTQLRLPPKPDDPASAPWAAAKDTSADQP